MKKIELGKTGLQVSRVGFGGIPITRVSKEDAVRLLRKAFDAGINFVDTAVGYGDSEEKIGAAVSGQKREALILASKSMAREAEKMTADIEQSRKRMRTAYLDLYQAHGINNFAEWKKVTGAGGALEALQEARRKGIVRHAGFSSHSLDVAREAVTSGLFETVQIPFNFITSEPETKILPLLEKHPLGLIVMKPFAGGVIPFAGPALKYLFRFPGAVPIPGIEKEEELDEIVAVTEAGGPLSATDKRKIAQLRKTIGANFCRRCGYCLPCPQQINIPLALHYESLYRRFPEENTLHESGKRLIDRVRACAGCGECEKKCPFELPIRKMLKETIAFYDEKLTASRRSSPPSP